MDSPNLIAALMPVILMPLLTGVSLPFSAAGRKDRRPRPGADGHRCGEYLYVPCTRMPGPGRPAETRHWVQQVPIVKKTPDWIFYTSDTWDRSETVAGPGCISRQEFEAGRHGYPPGVIPIPGRRPGSAGRLFFASRQAAEDHLRSGLPPRARQARREAAPAIAELRRAMAEAHPDRGGTTGQFIEAHDRYQAALRVAGRRGGQRGETVVTSCPCARGRGRRAGP